MPHRLLLCLFFTCVKILIFSYPKCTETRAICTLAVKRTLDWPVLPANQMGMYLTDAEMELSNKQLKLKAKSPRKKIVPNLRQFFRKRLIWVTRYKMRYSLHDKKKLKNAEYLVSIINKVFTFEEFNLNWSIKYFQSTIRLE